MGEYDGRGKIEDRQTIHAVSPDGFDDALKVAIHNSGAEPGTTFIVTLLEVVTVDDPKIGEYKVTIARGPA